MIMYQKQWTVCRISDNLLSLSLNVIFSVFFHFGFCLFCFCSLKCSWNGCQVLDQDSKSDEEAKKKKKSTRWKILVGIAWTAPFIKRERTRKKERTSSNIFIKYFHKILSEKRKLRSLLSNRFPSIKRARFWRTLIFFQPYASLSYSLPPLLLLALLVFLFFFFLFARGLCVEKRMFEISIF